MGKYYITIYNYFWISTTLISNYAPTAYLIQKPLKWVKNYSFYSRNCYVKAQTDEMSCPVLFIIWVDRNDLKPVAEIKGEFVLLDEQVLQQTWKDTLQQIFLKYDEKEEKGRR